MASRLSGADPTGIEHVRQRLAGLSSGLYRVAHERSMTASSPASAVKRLGTVASEVLDLLTEVTEGGVKPLDGGDIVKILTVLEKRRPSSGELVVSTANADGSGSATPNVSRRALNLDEVADLYGRDAHDDTVRGAVMTAIGLTVGGAAAGLAVTIAVMQLLGSDLATRVLVTVLCAVFMLWIVAAGVLALGGRERRSARNLKQVERQLRSVEPYLAPLDSRSAAMIRGVLAGRVFSEGEAEEMLWQQPWPGAEQFRDAAP